MEYATSEQRTAKNGLTATGAKTILHANGRKSAKHKQRESWDVMAMYGRKRGVLRTTYGIRLRPEVHEALCKLSTETGNSIGELIEESVHGVTTFERRMPEGRPVLPFDAARLLVEMPNGKLREFRPVEGSPRTFAEVASA